MIRFSSVVGAVLLLTACGASTPPATAANVDLGRVKVAAEQIYPAGGFSCAHSAQAFAGCPFTSRLRTRLQALSVPADLVCRCQNSYTGATIVADDVGGKGVAHAALSFGPGSVVKLDWVFVQEGGRYLADDQYCTSAGAGASVYTNTAPCS